MNALLYQKSLIIFQYIIALTIELISLSFMMGRISYLALRSKKGRPERAKESDGMRVLRALRRQ